MQLLCVPTAILSQHSCAFSFPFFGLRGVLIKAQGSSSGMSHNATWHDTSSQHMTWASPVKMLCKVSALCSRDGGEGYSVADVSNGIDAGHTALAVLIHLHPTLLVQLNPQLQPPQHSCFHAKAKLRGMLLGLYSSTLTPPFSPSSTPSCSIHNTSNSTLTVPNIRE